MARGKTQQMDAATLWKRYRDWLYYHEELGIYVDISRISFDETLVDRLTPRFETAFQAMADLEAGAIANPDEERMVGHYWLRDPDLAPTETIKREVIDTLEQIESLVAKVHSGALHPAAGDRFTDILSVGIGGSALGPEFVADALAPLDAPLDIHFIDNSDPQGIDRTLAQLGDRLSTTLVFIISKSGGTPETRNGMIEVKAAFDKAGLDFTKQAVAITGIDSKLDRQAQREGWLGRLPMADWVGGRTSEMSAVGLPAAALQGIDIRAMLAGAKAMDEATRVRDLKQNPAALLALAWYAATNGQGEKDMVILPYKDSLLLFSRYLQQLVMESLGKETDLDGNIVHQGIAVYGNKGSTDQHAYVQQLREGVPNFFVTFIEVLGDRQAESTQIDPGVTSGDYLSGFLQGTRQALFDNQRDSITITVPEVSPFSVGMLIALYERAVGFYASLVNVNAYHQPGVEAGKKAAAAVLSVQQEAMAVLKQANKPMSLEELATAIGQPDQVEILYKILRHLHANQRGVTLIGNLGRPSSLQVSAF